MKNNTLKYSLIVGFLFLLIACSTKRNNLISRSSHSLSTEYNILYNGGLALDKGVEELKTTYKDNFWKRLPIERMQVSKDIAIPGKTKNANFDRAETKAIMAIQKHSMNIEGIERNSQMDEAHLMLGQARYYDQRYVPALEAFNYILYKYANSDKIYEVKVWREKTNLRMENDALAVKNLKRLLSENKLKNQVLADANATLAQAFLNLEEVDCAVERLKVAAESTKHKEEKARYHFILGQLYEELGKKDSAFISYQSVIDMKRKSPRRYVIQAHIRQAQQFDYEKGDTVAFLEKYKKLLKDRENRPFLDALNHQMGSFYDKNKKYAIAEKYYNKSLKAKTEDTYLTASNYRNLAGIYFNKAKFKTSGQYYDSTLVQLNVNSREYRSIKRKRENLNDVIKHEGLVSRNDSILNVVSLSESGRVSFYENYIVKLKKEDEIKKALEEKEKEKELKLKEETKESGDTTDDVESPLPGKLSTAPPAAINAPKAKESNFYFYNATTVAFGKTEFRKNWGERSYKNNWRLSISKSTSEGSEGLESDNEPKDGLETVTEVNEKYQTAYYLKQLPQTQTSIDSIIKERNFSNYQLGSIYKEKFKEYELAASKLEKVLSDNPEERLILPSMYNLYKIYEIIDRNKMLAMKEKIISKYPDSRYAQILSNPNADNIAIAEGPESAYKKLYKLFESGDYRTTYSNVEEAISSYSGEELVSKFELLKANTIGKLKGVQEYKKALNFVSLNYPYSDEGKQAEALLTKDIPVLEALKLNAEAPKSWKILYKVDYRDPVNIKISQDTINKFIMGNSIEKLTLSNDIYTMNENFIVIHNINSEEHAKEIAAHLRDDEKYKLTLTPIIISNYNYKVVQIKKNLDDYLNPDFVEKVTEVPEPKPAIATPIDPVLKPFQPPAPGVSNPMQNPGMPPGANEMTLPTNTKPKNP